MIGPSIPEHLLKKSQDKEHNVPASPPLPSVDDTNSPPHPPPSTDTDHLDDDDLADAFMPELPPDLLPAAPAAPAVSSKRRTMGPARPPPSSSTSTYHDDDDDNTIGPMMPSQYDRDQAALSSTITAIEERAKQSEKAMTEAASGQGKVERPEWMLAPPDVDYLKNANTGRTRTFNQRTVDAATRDSSGWTDTPADKARKQQQGETDGTKATTAAPRKPTQAELETRRKVEQHNQSERSMSLLEMHRMNKGKKRKTGGAEDDPSKRPFDREKDLMGSRQMSKKQKKELLEKSSEWSDRFSSNTRSGSFL